MGIGGHVKKQKQLKTLTMKVIFDESFSIIQEHQSHGTVQGIS